MRKQLLAVFMACLMAGLAPRLCRADNSVNATIVDRKTDQQNTQLYLLTNANGGGIAIGPARASENYRLAIGSASAAVTQVAMDTATTPSSPYSGFWYDATSLGLIHFTGGIKQFDPGVFYVSTGPAAISNSATVSTVTFGMTTIYGTTTLPANFFVAGRTLRFKVVGDISTIPTVPGTLTVNVLLGTTTIAGSGAFTPGAGVSSRTFTLDGLLTCVATGNFAAGSAIGQFSMLYSSNTAPGSAMMVDSRVTSATNFDTTVANALNITVQWGTASTGNIILPTNIVYEALN